MATAYSAGTYQDIEALISALARNQANAADPQPEQDPQSEEHQPVQHLHLSCCDIDNVAVGRIAEAIAGAPDVSHTIESVNLGWNDILGDSIYSLVQSLRPLSGLVKLDLNYNSIGDDGAKQLALLIQETNSLTFLDLVKNSINAAGAQALAEALSQNSSLKALHLGMNNIGDEGLVHIAGALTTNQSLLTLDLEINSIGPKGVEELAAALSEMNSTLTAISLQENNICDEGALALATVLQQSESLGMLDIRTNQITSIGCGAIASALRDSPLAFLDLDLRGNSMDADVNGSFEQLSDSDCEIQVSWDFSPDEESSSITAAAGAQAAPKSVDTPSESSPSPEDVANTSASNTQTVERMLGIIADTDDIAFDNATWYLTKQPELCNQMWASALAADKAAMMRCLSIVHNMIEYSLQLQPDSFPTLTIQSCIDQLDNLVELLRKDDGCPPVTTTFGTVEVRFGLLRLAVVDIIGDLIESESMVAAEAICKCEVLDVIVNHFFAYDWNDCLHCSVMRIVTALLNPSSSSADKESTVMLRKRLFGPADQGGCDLLKRMIDVFLLKCPQTELEETEQPEASMSPGEQGLPGVAIEKLMVRASCTCGYLRCVIDTATMLSEAPRLVSELGSSQLTEEWESFNENVIEKLKPIKDECLGGGVPPQSAAPQCGQM